MFDAARAVQCPPRSQQQSMDYYNFDEHEDYREGDSLPHGPPGTADNAWRESSNLVGRYDKAMCDAYREQIDTLLVFAGLFSAVVTTFASQSYQWLQSTADDESVHLLRQIAVALSPNQTTSSPAASAPTDSAAARINALWFTSLTLSLSAALVGIVAKQWIREYDRDAARTNQEALGVRQMKFQGFEAWRVSEVVYSVPLLLQASLALFLAGILDLLWGLDSRVAMPVTIAVFSAALFYVATTLLPAVSFARWYFTPASTTAQCPYKSPQSWLILRGFHSVVTLFKQRKVRGPGDRTLADRLRLLRLSFALLRSARSWIEYDLAWTAVSDAESIARPEYRFLGLAWLRKKLDDAKLPIWIWHCIWDNCNLEQRTCRSAINVICFVKDLPSADFAILPGLESKTEQELQPYCLAACYALETPMPGFTSIDAVCRIGLGEEKPSKALVSWIMSWIEKIHHHSAAPKDHLPNSLCEQLLRLLHAMAPWGRSDDEFGRTICYIQEMVLRQNPSERQIAASLELCDVTTDWLLADPHIMWRHHMSFVVLRHFHDTLDGSRFSSSDAILRLARTLDRLWAGLAVPKARAPELHLLAMQPFRRLGKSFRDLADREETQTAPRVLPGDRQLRDSLRPRSPLRGTLQVRGDPSTDRLRLASLLDSLGDMH